MKYKLLVLDVDGTLLNDQKEITPNTLSTLVKVQQMGVHWFWLPDVLPTV